MDHYSVSDGLSNSVVNDICQDKYGFIWIATDDGLNRFDGYRFKTYRTSTSDTTSISDSFVQRLFLDSKGQLWVGTRRGFNIYHPSCDCFTRINSTLDVTSITESEDGIIYYSYAGSGVAVVDKDVHKEVGVISGRYYGSTMITSIHSESKDVFFVLGSEHVGLFSIKANKETDILIADADESFFSATRGEREKTYYVYSSKKVILVDFADSLKIVESYKLPEKWLDNTFVGSLLMDSGSKLWLSNKKGLFLLNRKLKEFESVEVYVDKEKKINFGIESIFEDRSGNLWLGDYGNGVLLKPHLKNVFFLYQNNPYNENSLSNNHIASFAEDESGLVWIGTWGGGLNYFDPAQQTVHRYDFKNEALNKAIFRGACVDRNNDLWLATNSIGLIRLDKNRKNFKWYRHDPDKKGSLSDDNMYSVFNVMDGEVWIGHSTSGLSHYNFETGLFDDYLNDTINGLNVPVRYIRTLIEDRYGKLWFGSYGWGVNSIDLEKSELDQYNTTLNPYNSSYLNNSVVYAVMEDSHGFIWIGTMGGGLNLLDPQTHRVWYITEKDGLANNVVNGIIEDDNQILWISTNNGISRFAIPDYLYSGELPDDFPDEFDLNPYFINYNIDDGLQNNEFKYGSYFKSSTGEIYFGGISGFNVFHPDSIRINLKEPELVITGFSIFKKLQSNKTEGSPLDGYIGDLDRIELKYNQNQISFDFVAISFINSRKNKYMYKLEGFEDQWNVTSDNLTANYNNLRPGEYTFRVMAANNDGIWTRESKDITVYIKPPFWAKLWFQAILVFSILSILFSFYQYRLFVLRQRSRELEMRVDRRTKQLKQANEELEKRKDEIEAMAKMVHENDQMKLRFFTNISHEFRTPLTMIIGPVERLFEDKQLSRGIKNQLQIIYRNSLRLLHLINELLDIRKLDTGNIRLKVSRNNFTDFVRGLVSLFELHAKKRNISLDIIAGNRTMDLWFDPNLMEKVIYNLLSNSFKYIQDSGKIEIGILYRDMDNIKYLEVYVKDDGEGISEEHQKYIFDRFYQIQNSRALNSKYGSGIGLALCKEYVELHHGKINVESVIGEGTKFTILIPLGNDHFSEDEILSENDGFKRSDYFPIFDSDYIVNPEIAEESGKPGNLPLVLVIDDNPDIQTYIYDLLKEKYQVILAPDGESGFEKAMETIPDLIICDILMPGTDGINITGQLKEHLQTNHIPIILLSALASEDDRIRGLEFGADDYITKPFSSRVLRAKVDTLIENRKKLRVKFRQETGFDFNSAIKSSPHEKFLSKMLDILEENYSDEDFSIEEFASQAGMSRTQLYRKVDSMTGQSVSEFIRTFRMRKAIDLLRSGENNISQVAYSVGYKSLSHFSRTFTSVFKESPTQFLSRNK